MTATEIIPEPKTQQIIEWMEHLKEMGEDWFPEVHQRLSLKWMHMPNRDEQSNSCSPEFAQAVLSLHREYPEFVCHGRKHWSLTSLFEGRSWRESPRGKPIWRGTVPPLLDYHPKFPENLQPSLLDHQSPPWALADRTKDGRGLGIVGPYGNARESYAVRAVFEMFRNHPFKTLKDAESLSEPTGRTASFFRASEIAKALEDTFRLEDCLALNVAKGIVEDCQEHEVLVIVGIGEVPMGVSASNEFYNILEHRRMNRHPTVWTTQFLSAELGKRFSPRIGGLLVQNLSRGAEIVKLAKQPHSNHHPASDAIQGQQAPSGMGC